jgi:hypothetical protein
MTGKFHDSDIGTKRRQGCNKVQYTVRDMHLLCTRRRAGHTVMLLTKSRYLPSCGLIPFSGVALRNRAGPLLQSKFSTGEIIIISITSFVSFCTRPAPPGHYVGIFWTGLNCKFDTVTVGFIFFQI